MSEEHSPELERRLRENKGRLRWPEIAQALTDALPPLKERDLVRLSLAETDELRASCSARLASDPYIDRRTWDDSDREEVQALLARSAAAHMDRVYVVFHHLDRLTGAVLLNGASVLSDVARVWEAVREDLCLVSRDLEHGLCLELNHYSRGDELELGSWGALVPPPK